MMGQTRQMQKGEQAETGKKARPLSVIIQKHFIYYNSTSLLSPLSVLQISFSAICVSLQPLWVTIIGEKFRNNFESFVLDTQQR